MKKYLFTKYTKKLILLCTSTLFFLIVFIFSGCKTIPVFNNETLDINENLPVDYLCPSELAWEPLTKDTIPQEGFQIIKHNINELKVKWTCIKADLSTPGLKLVTSFGPSTHSSQNPQQSKDQELVPELKYVSDFAKEQKTIVAINSSPWKDERGKIEPVGIVKIDGVEYFPPQEKYAALCFTLEPLEAFILKNQQKEKLDKYQAAFGGFYQILENGKIIEFNKTRRSRVAVGTGSQGKELYFFIVTSVNNPKDNNGFTFEECAMILKKLGAVDAMQFDGGHSSNMVINEKVSQKPLLNRKIPLAIGLKK